MGWLAVMHCAAFLYPTIFILATVLFLRLDKVESQKNFYAAFPDQQECFQNLLRPYTQDAAAQLFTTLPVLINQCSFPLIRGYFRSIRAGYRSALFLSREQEMKDILVSHHQFVFSDDEQCLIVHASEFSEDIRLELKMKKKHPSCRVVKVSTQAAPDMDNQVDVVRAKLTMTFERHASRIDQKSIDLDTLIRVYLKNRYIEALYLDESVNFEDLLNYANEKDFAKLFPVCQLTVTLKRPRTRNDETKFWHFVRYFVVDSQMVLVSSRLLNRDTLDVVFYNPVYGSCNFKHFSIPFDRKGTKF